MMPDADRVHYISINGEVLESVRAVALTLGSVLEIAVATALIASYPAYSLGAPALGLLAGPWALAVSLEGKQSIIDPVASNLGLVNKHSQSLLVLLQYAKDNSHSDWATIANPLLTGWLDENNTIAKTLGLTNDQMLRQIAYTALDSGETPFGISAIKALFNDANEAETNTISLDFTSKSWSPDSSVESASKFSVQKNDLVEKLTKGYLNTHDIYKVDVIISAAQKSDTILTARSNSGKNDLTLFLSDGLNDTIFGTAGDDFIYAYDAGNDVVDGGGGINTSFYKDRISNYKIVNTETGISVTELLSGANHTDILMNIQQLKFADEFIPFSDAIGITVIYDFDSPLSKQISALYEICFDRLPDVAGIRYWEENIKTWGNDNQAFLKVAQSFLANDEYLSSHQGLTNEQFVDDLYRDAFDRNADDAGRSHWLNDLNNGVERANILVGFSESSEMGIHREPYANMSSGFWAI